MCSESNGKSALYVSLFFSVLFFCFSLFLSLKFIGATLFLSKVDDLASVPATLLYVGVDETRTTDELTKMMSTFYMLKLKYEYEFDRVLYQSERYGYFSQWTDESVVGVAEALKLNKVAGNKIIVFVDPFDPNFSVVDKAISWSDCLTLLFSSVVLWVLFSFFVGFSLWLKRHS